jgi:hypothetical protein
MSCSGYSCDRESSQRLFDFTIVIQKHSAMVRRKEQTTKGARGGAQGRGYLGRKHLLLRVNLEPYALGLRRILNILVHSRRAEPVLKTLV